MKQVIGISLKTRTIFALWTAFFCHNFIALAQTWTSTGAPNIGWEAVASSANGNKLFAIGMAGQNVYGTSTNAGSTWTTNQEPQIGNGYGSWNCVASSANGNILMAMNYNGVWTSTNSGVSWLSNNVPGVNFWKSVALSADGTKAAAADGRSGPGGIYVSTNCGATWRQTSAPIEPWASIASSADGTKLAAAVVVSSLPTVPVYVSTNSGATWTPTGTPTNMQCASVAASADGRKLIVVGFSAVNGGIGLIYTSTNSGTTWISNNVVSVNKQWEAVASSADGNTLVAASQGWNAIFTSTNSGATWISNNAPADVIYLSVASSADGAKLATAIMNSAFGGGIYTSQSTSAPQLKSTLANGSLVLSWLIPSTNFVLQDNADLTTTNWADVTNAPMLNFTNLKNEVTLPAPAGRAFYRLKIP